MTGVATAVKVPGAQGYRGTTHIVIPCHFIIPITVQCSAEHRANLFVRYYFIIKIAFKKSILLGHFHLFTLVAQLHGMVLSHSQS